MHQAGGRRPGRGRRHGVLQGGEHRGGSVRDVRPVRAVGLGGRTTPRVQPGRRGGEFVPEDPRRHGDGALEVGQGRRLGCFGPGETVQESQGAGGWQGNLSLG